MDQQANSILAELEFAAGEGALRFKGVRYLLIRPETLAAWQAALEAELGAERAGELVYAGGFSGGQLSGRRYRDALGLSAAEAVAFMCRMGGEIGWGRFTLVHFAPEAATLEVAVHASPFAAAHGPAGQGVCHLIRGVLGGLVAGLCAVDVVAREEACAARGDPECRFHVAGVPVDPA
jgi:predicted hydrocarbon binding protein